MDKPVTVYMERDFYEEYAMKRKKDEYKNSDRHTNYAVENLDDFIEEECTVLIDMSDDEIRQLLGSTQDTAPTRLLKNFIKKSQNAGSDVLAFKRDFSIIKSLDNDVAHDYLSRINSQQAIFLMSENTNLELDKHYGLFQIKSHLEDIRSKSNLLFTRKIQLPFFSSQYVQWTEFEQFAHPFNSIVIEDAHILKDNYKYGSPMPIIKHNLLVMLKSILKHKDMSIPLQVTFVLDRDNSTRHPDNPPKYLEKIYTELETELKSIINAVELTICWGKVHDRYIYTNYFVYQSGYGFSLLDTNNKLMNLETMITGNSYASFLTDMAGEKIHLHPSLISVAHIFRDATKKHKNFIGSGRNRLLESII